MFNNSLINIIFKSMCHNFAQHIKPIKSIKHLYFEINQNKSSQLLKINGWIRGRIQRKKYAWFIFLDDGSTAKRLQVIIPQHMIEQFRKLRIGNGTSIECIGTLSSSLGRLQDVDFHCHEFKVIGHCDSNSYVIGHLKTGMELNFLREKVHLRPRVRYFQSILRIRHELSRGIHQFMQENDFFEIQIPVITSNDCEGGGECFTLKPVNCSENSYFGRTTYLTVSGQLHLEAMASSLSRVYSLNTVFRAEKSMSPKHLSEFLMLEVEQAFLFSLDSLLDLVESLIKYLIMHIEQKCNLDLQYLLDKNQHHQYYDKLKNLKFLRIPYREVCRMLAEKFPELQNEHHNFNSEMERTLLKMFDYQSIFVTEFPIKTKPFYMKVSDNESTMQCFDLLSPVCGEVCGGSLRENDLEKIVKQIRLKNMDLNTLEWYLDLRRYGSVPTGGFGLGFDRLIQTIAGIKNIKDVVPFPRWPYHCYL